MNSYCSFLSEKILIGKFPSQEEVTLLTKKGVDVFINLTSASELLTEYKSKEKLSYEIPDKKVPKDMESFLEFINKIVKLYKDGKTLYIHCRGGHGRTGLVGACLLIVLFSMNSTEALAEVKKRHKEREIMEERWRKLGAPQTKIQKEFVINFAKKMGRD